jgi:hypothetical protein
MYMSDARRQIWFTLASVKDAHIVAAHDEATNDVRS